MTLMTNSFLYWLSSQKRNRFLIVSFMSCAQIVECYPASSTVYIIGSTTITLVATSQPLAVSNLPPALSSAVLDESVKTEAAGAEAPSDIVAAGLETVLSGLREVVSFPIQVQPVSDDNFVDAAARCFSFCLD